MGQPTTIKDAVDGVYDVMGGNEGRDVGALLWEVIRAAIAKGLIAYYQKYKDEASKRELKDLFLQYDKGLMVSDSRRCEPKKFGGKGARARFQKSYR